MVGIDHIGSSIAGNGHHPLNGVHPKDYVSWSDIEKHIFTGELSGNCPQGVGTAQWGNMKFRQNRLIHSELSLQ